MVLIDPLDTWQMDIRMKDIRWNYPLLYEVTPPNEAWSKTRYYYKSRKQCQKKVFQMKWWCLSYTQHCMNICLLFNFFPFLNFKKFIWTVRIIAINFHYESHWSFVSMSNKLTFVSNYYMSCRVGGIMFYLYYICECNFVIPSSLWPKRLTKNIIVGINIQFFV